MTKMNFPARILATAVTCIGLFPIPLLADTGPEKPASAEKSADDQDLTEIVVTATGTSIRGVAPVGADLITFGRDDIVASGAETVGDIVNSIPQLGLFNQSQNPGVAGAISAVRVTGRGSLRPQDY